MGWIKRNLYFTILGLVALVGLGGAIFYNFKSWRHDSNSMDQVKDAYGKLQKYYDQPITPCDTNIDAEKLQEQQLQDWTGQAQAHFIPVPPIPNPPGGAISTEVFAGSLRKTIHDMQLAAVDANVDLPADYSFSFAAERNLVTFSPNSLTALASHLGEIKAICDVMFDAKINGIDSIQREILSDNDTAGPQSDYLAEKSRTVGDLATITPYAITFRCFSGDLGKVISRFATSNHGFIVTGINVMPAGGMPGAGGNTTGVQTLPNPQPGGLQTVLDEQLLRVSLGIEVVKLTK